MYKGKRLFLGLRWLISAWVKIIWTIICLICWIFFTTFFFFFTSIKWYHYFILWLFAIIFKFFTYLAFIILLYRHSVLFYIILNRCLICHIIWNVLGLIYHIILNLWCVCIFLKKKRFIYMGSFREWTISMCLILVWLRFVNKILFFWYCICVIFLFFCIYVIFFY